MTEITVFGVCCRRFIFGYRSVPPATNWPTGPASAMIFTAFATVRGTRYSNLGKRIIRFTRFAYELLRSQLERRLATFENHFDLDHRLIGMRRIWDHSLIRTINLKIQAF